MAGRGAGRHGAFRSVLSRRGKAGSVVRGVVGKARRGRLGRAGFGLLSLGEVWPAWQGSG